MPTFRASFTSQALTRAAALFCLLALAVTCAGQSSDLGFPTPVLTNEVSGRIAPRDVGDPRRTRHYYTFRGTEGDLSVTFESSELIGAVDVFTATTQRPLLKITLLGDSTRASKSFYLRKEETLVLRVEARALGDAEGAYRISFGGSFSPAPAELAGAAPAPAPSPTPAAERRGVRRVTSTGARIDEPAPPAEVAKEATPAPTPEPEKTAERKEPPAPRRGRASRTPPNRNRGAGGSRPAAGSAKTESAENKTDDPARPTESKPEAATPEAAAAKPAPTPRRRGSRNARRSPGGGAGTSAGESAGASRDAAGAQPSTPVEPAPLPSQRLVIVTREGETLERDMNTIRRVTVENNQLVVVGKDGKVTRRPMASVLRMSIEP